MAVEAISGTATASVQRASLGADALPTVTLAQMIATRSGSASLAAASFGDSLAGVLGTMPSITHAGGSSGGSVDTGSLAVPDTLRAYGNGKIPREALSPIGIGQHRLWQPAAEGFVSMRAAAAADGVDIGVTDSYRSYDQQVTLAAQKGLYQNGGYAAVPGTSPHGWGMALDVDVTTEGLAWLRANGAKYGFVEAVPREPWHWEFRG